MPKSNDELLGTNKLGKEEIDSAANATRQIIKLTDFGMDSIINSITKP